MAPSTNTNTITDTPVPLRPSPATQRLRDLLADPQRIIVAPGVYEGISARIALSLGFEALYMVSFFFLFF